METSEGEFTIHKIEAESKRGRFKLPVKFRLPRLKIRLRKKIVIPVLFILFVIFYFGLSTFLIYSRTKALVNTSNGLAESFQKQDLKSIKEKLDNVRNQLNQLNGTYKLISWMGFVPVAGPYIRDGQALITGAGYGLDAANESLELAELYSDILGFNGGESQEGKNGEKTTQERLDFVVNDLPNAIPKIDLISQKVSLAREQIDKIDPDRYPKTLFGKPVQEKVRQGVDTIILADDFLKSGKPLLSSAPYLLGVDKTRRYLVLFQNDKELRPTGGFMTGYSLAEVEKAKFKPVNSSDIYSLDASYRPSVPAPKPIVDYIKGPYVLNKNLRLRDMNWSPDFKESMELFLEEASEAGIKDVDGIIAVDTHLLVNVIKVLGTIGVPGYGNFTTDIEPKCNCPQVIYELESFADVEGPIVWDPLDPTRIIYAPANIDNRKKIIGPLMNSVLANSLAQPKEKIPELTEAVFKSVTEKHVLLYMVDEDAQKAAESFGIAGRIEDFDGDYLHINDANLGGRKSNLYVTQEVSQQVTIARDGSVEKTVEITYQNPQDYDGWLNSLLPTWTRIYIPKGSEVTDITGFEEIGDTYEELGKTVVSGGFVLRPKGITKISLTYKLPSKVDRNYKLLIQKQPGTDAPLYTIEVNGKPDEFYLRTDRKLTFKVR